MLSGMLQAAPVYALRKASKLATPIIELFSHRPCCLSQIYRRCVKYPSDLFFPGESEFLYKYCAFCIMYCIFCIVYWWICLDFSFLWLVSFFEVGKDGFIGCVSGWNIMDCTFKKYIIVWGMSICRHFFYISSSGQEPLTSRSEGKTTSVKDVSSHGVVS